MSTMGTVTPHVQKRRMPLWDNARWIAITLMVIGHAILKLIADSDVAYGAYLFIYAFHVPLFVAVSGYFAKSGPPGMRQLHRLMTDIVFPYLIFETIWTVLRWMLGGNFWLDYATASWTLWFLLALAVWRIVLPYIVILRYPLIISIIASVGVGYIGSVDDSFTLSRTIGFLPFFVFGWKIRQWQITGRWLDLPTAAVWRWRAGAIALFTGFAVFVMVNVELLRDLKVRRFLLYNESYEAFGYDQLWAGGIRLGLMVFAGVLIMAFLMLIPRGTTWYSSLGGATMYIYLLHSFVLYPFRESGVLGGPQPWWVLPGMIVLSIGISFVLSQQFVRKAFRPLVEPRARWLFRTETATPTGTIVLPPKEPK